MKTKWIYNLRIECLIISLFCGSILASCSGDDSDDGDVDSSDEQESVESVETIYTIDEGNYTGTWRNEQNQTIGISAILTVEESRVRGVFYYTPNFRSCCASGANDGAVSFTLDENDIKSVVWNDQVPNCEGSFRGSGDLTGDSKFTIRLSGEDCNGPLEGTIQLDHI